MRIDDYNSGLKRWRIFQYFSKRFTFMVIPHGAGTPRQINIHLSHIVLFLIAWTGITCWGSYLSAQHIDYWRIKVTNQVLTLKINYLIGQLDESSGFLDEVKQMEAQLRDMLKYKDEAALIQNTPPSDKGATGGPTFAEATEITSLLKNSGRDISWTHLMEKSGYLKSQAHQRIASFQDISQYIDMRRKLYRATPMGWPCPGQLTSHFGKRIDPFSKLEEFHCSVDISGPFGTPIKSTADGIVRIASWHSGYGNLVVVEHSFGYSTRYAHNSRFVVKVGDRVKRGQTLALMGATGKASGPHSHYEVWRYSTRQNPYSYLRASMPAIKGTTKSTTKNPTASES